MTPAPKYETQVHSHWRNRFPPSESDECTKTLSECMSLEQLCLAPEVNAWEETQGGNFDVEEKEIKCDSSDWGVRRTCLSGWQKSGVI